MKQTEKPLARVLVEMLEEASDTQIEETTRECVNLLIARGELHRFKDVIEAIEYVWAEKFGAATITIETAYPISKTLREKLHVLAKGVEVKEKITPELIGGARVRVDGKVIDGSIETHLATLGRAFMNV